MGRLRLAPVSRESDRCLTPRRDPEAAQREMASPPSDGSQSWDVWGPVATPALIAFGAGAGDAQSGEVVPPDSA